MRRVVALAIGLTFAAGALVAPATGAVESSTRAAAQPRETIALTLGTALPDTGSLKAYGPATQAAVLLAVQDANAAGGVLGTPVTLAPGDSGGAGSSTFARTLARLDAAQAVIGPLSSSLVLDNLDAVAGRTLISPATSSAELSSVLARVVPAEPLAGAMLATLARQRGAVRLVVVGPRDQRPLVDAALDRARDIGLETSSVVYTSRQSAASIAGRVVRSSADALLMASGAETTGILRELLVRGMPATVLLTPIAAAGVVPRDLRRGSLDGALTVDVDLRVPRSLATRVKQVAPQATEMEYSAQAYDAAAIAILAAEQSGQLLGSITPEGLRAALPAVTAVGTACETIEKCLRLLRRGVDIDYIGYGGPFALDSAGDPGAARYLARTYTEANKPSSSARPVRYP